MLPLEAAQARSMIIITLFKMQPKIISDLFSGSQSAAYAPVRRQGSRQ